MYLRRAERNVTFTKKAELNCTPTRWTVRRGG